MQKVRAKFKVTHVTNHESGGVEVNLSAVYSSDPESPNKTWAEYTPAGTIKMAISPNKEAIKAFVPGKECYVDFTFED